MAENCDMCKKPAKLNKLHITRFAAIRALGWVINPNGPGALCEECKLPYVGLRVNDRITDLRTILEWYGFYQQKDKVFEELTEFSVAYFRANPDLTEHGAVYREDLFNLLDETADLLIMLSQLSLHLGIDAVNARIDYKIDRQLQRIDELEKKEN